MEKRFMNRRTFFGLAGAAAAGSVPVLAFAATDMQKQFKITGIETDILRFPPGRIFYDAIHEFGSAHGGLAVRIHTNAGITGWGTSSFGMLPGGADAMRDIIQNAIKPILVGQDPAFQKRLRADMWKALEYASVVGLNQFVISVVEIALWDIIGKAYQTPVYRLLGPYADRMPAYSMCGWYYPNDNDQSQFKKEVEAALEEGFSGVKIKVGRYSLQDDVARIKIAKELAGPNRLVMVDANQKFTVAEAIQRGKVYQEMGCYWFEEPIVPYDHAGYARIAEELQIRIAGGENEYTKYGFADLISRRCVSIVQPDGRRAGGVSEWIEIGALADAAGLLVASHGGGPDDLQMLLAMPNAVSMESGSYKGQSSTVEQLKMVDSNVLAPITPGMGTELRPDYFEKHKA
jgi:L-alanine-DL-glutamate epimerase-like enolase superfamily enzyme